MAPEIEQLARKYMRCPVQVTIGMTSGATTNENIDQIINMVKESAKKVMLVKVYIPLLSVLLSIIIYSSADYQIIRNNPLPAIVFCKTKDRVDNVTRELREEGFNCVSLRSGISQEQREQALEDFREGVYDILVATNVAARGLDIKGVCNHTIIVIVNITLLKRRITFILHLWMKNANCQVKLVVNYDMPTVFDDYVHRIGRTGRAGATGRAISLVTEDDQALFPELVDYLKQKGQRIPEELARHKVVREAMEVAHYKADEKTDPTEFRMI